MPLPIWSVPPATVVPPVYVLLPERIIAPPPLTLNAMPVYNSPIAPLTVSVLPGVAVTLRLLLRLMGTAIVWLPPLLAIVAAAPLAFHKLSVFVPVIK